jgi:Secretion system C-terminal sorting domain
LASFDNSSFGLPTSGINYGSLGGNGRYGWAFFPVCDSGLIHFNFTQFNIFDTMGYAIYGPFQDTTQIVSKLQTTSPIFSQAYSSPFNFNISLPPFVAGLYYIVFNISQFNGNYLLNGSIVNPFYNNYICGFCNSYFPFQQHICLVTYDSISQRNQLIWDKGDTNNLSGYIIYRENSVAGTFDSLAFVYRDSANQFIDWTANPNSRIWRYIIHRFDACMNRLPTYFQTNAYPFSSKSLFLQQGNISSNAVNLTWNTLQYNAPYFNGGFYQTFYIYRSNGISPPICIDSVPYPQINYSDLNPNQGTNYYQVSMKKIDPCNITRSNQDEAKSNIITTIFTGLHNPVKHNFFKLYPNPAQHEFTVEINENNKDWRLSLFNLQGQLLKTEDAKSKSKIQLNCEDLPAGIYTVKVSYLNSDYYKKLVIE